MSDDNSPEERDSPGRIELLAHDLRAALADVMGGLRLMSQVGLPDDARTQLERVLASSELLSRLVEDVLVAEGIAPTDVGDAVTDLRRLIEDELKRWRGAAQPQGVTVSREVDAAVPQLLRCEALPLRRTLTNAMGNAVRYARTSVTLRVARNDAGDIILTVLDDGPGFPPDKLPLDFAPSNRGDGSLGTGMGLHIAAAHAEQVGGRLSAGNRPEGGAYVTLHLPADLAAGDVPPVRAVADLTGWRVLVADDSEALRTLLKGMFAKLGAECETARDGIVALNWLARERFDLAVLDVEMPLLGGRAVIQAERLRQARGVAPPTPLIALTAHGSDAMREALLDDGADGVLFKPLPDTESFGRMLAELIDLSGVRPDWRPEAAPVLSAATLSELMMAAGPDHAPEMLARLKDDLRAVEEALGTALETPDIEAIRFQSHILVSLAGAVGALPTLSIARRISDLVSTDDKDAMRITGQMALARLRELRLELDKVV